MKVYLVEIDNEYNTSWIDKAFTTYKKASEWLINKEFEPYSSYIIKDDIVIEFRCQKNNENDVARIIEIKVEE